MTDGGTGPLEAGDFRSWLTIMDTVLAGTGVADVPCGSCTACCTASQFVHISPDEADALAHIPAELLFPAPGLPSGHVLMGYDERGHCPLLRDGACSIYAHRPHTCRTYDCRVFPAAGVTPDDPRIAERSARWQFSVSTAVDQTDRQAIEAAARFLGEHRSELADGARMANPTRRAVVAIEIRQHFTGPTAPTVDAISKATGRSAG